MSARGPGARARRRPAAMLPALVLAIASVAAGAEERAATLGRTIDRILDRPAFASAFWGVEIRSLKTGRTLYSRNATKSFHPASTLKLVITAAALDALGPEARLRTTVSTAGRLDGLGRVLGDVYLVGGGDPVLGGRYAEGPPTAAFEELVEGLRAAGVRRIEGRLVGQEGLFKGERRGPDWGWEDLVWWYGAEVSALSFNDACAHLTVGAGEGMGDPLVLDRSPLSSYYAVTSTAATSGPGTKADLTLFREPGSNLIRLSGTYPLGDKPWDGWVALEDPARYAITVFAEVLEARGIRVMGPVAASSDPLPAEARVLATHDSPPLADVLKVVNKESHNLQAEMLLRLLGARTKGEGSAEAGHQAVKEFLARLGVRTEGWELRDGSGLSRSDLLDPRGLVDLLAAMADHPQARAFRDSLPLAGIDGTLKSRLRGTRAGARLAAKTGTLRQVNALAGYATTPAGEPLAFAVMINNHTAPSSEATAAIDEIAALLTGR